MRFGKQKKLIQALDPDCYYMNYQYALLCVDDDVREQIEEAVNGMLRQHIKAAMSMGLRVQEFFEAVARD